MQHKIVIWYYSYFKLEFNSCTYSAAQNGLEYTVVVMFVTCGRKSLIFIIIYYSILFLFSVSHQLSTPCFFTSEWIINANLNHSPYLIDLFMLSISHRQQCRICAMLFIHQFKWRFQVKILFTLIFLDRWSSPVVIDLLCEKAKMHQFSKKSYTTSISYDDEEITGQANSLRQHSALVIIEFFEL